MRGRRPPHVPCPLHPCVQPFPACLKQKKTSLVDSQKLSFSRFAEGLNTHRGPLRGAGVPVLHAVEGGQRVEEHVEQAVVQQDVGQLGAGVEQLQQHAQQVVQQGVLVQRVLDQPQHGDDAALPERGDALHLLQVQAGDGGDATRLSQRKGQERSLHVHIYLYVYTRTHTHIRILYLYRCIYLFIYLFI